MDETVRVDLHSYINKPRTLLEVLSLVFMNLPSISLISSVGAFFVLFCFVNMLNYRISLFICFFLGGGVGGGGHFTENSSWRKLSCTSQTGTANSRVRR